MGANHEKLVELLIFRLLGPKLKLPLPSKDCVKLASVISYKILQVISSIEMHVSLYTLWKSNMPTDPILRIH